MSSDAYAAPEFLDWTLTADQIAQKADEIIEKVQAVSDSIAALDDDTLTWENTFQAIADVERWSRTQGSSIHFPQYVCEDKAIREASTEADRKLSQFDIDDGMRQDVFLKLSAAHQRILANPGDLDLDDEDKRFMEKVLLGYKRNGLELDQETQDKIKELKKELSDACIEFSKNMNEEVTKLHFSADELTGLPDDFVKSHPLDDDGKYVFTLKYPDLLPVMDKCQVEATRKTMEVTNSSKLIDENVPLFERAVQLRQQIAELMGYQHHAAYKLEVKMAKNSDAVMDMENELIEKLQPAAAAEKEKLLQLKEQECKDNGVDFDGKLNAWDFRYYHHKLLETEYQVDDEAIRQYFPIQIVTKALLDIYQELLGLVFTQVDQPQVWHKDVQLFQVHDAASNDFVGHFYLDLHPRDGKYTHAACFPLQPGCLSQDGSTRQKPAAAMVCNFNQPTEDKPSLLNHNEVVTYFHEFGHVMHGLCTQAKYARFAGTNVERDFVEAPSQMLENWVWQPEILERMSGHYKNTDDKLPKDTIDRMVAAKNANVALLTLRQIFFGVFDMTVHTNQLQGPSETLWESLRTDITKVEHTPGTNPVAAFGHLMGGYDAGYYGYLWSEVFSADMFLQFKQNGVMNTDMGAKYRKYILGTGGSRDSMDALVDFLGRDPSKDAFLTVKGL